MRGVDANRPSVVLPTERSHARFSLKPGGRPLDTSISSDDTGGVLLVYGGM